MNIVHLHLLLNHVPVIGAVIGIALLVVALVRRSDEVARISLSLFVLLGVVSVIVYLTGEPAEELVEDLPGVSESIMERHEDAALLATIAMGLVGAVAAAVLGMARARPLARWATPLVLAGALGATTIMGYAANLGGQVRHSEIRMTAALEEGMPDWREIAKVVKDRE